MKKLYTTTLFIILSFGFCRAQYVTIPDTSFVRYLQLTFPACMNGNQMDTTCPGIVNATRVACSDGYITDLTGIQYFKKVRVLSCYNNQLTGLPTLPATLTYLHCGWNPHLKSLPNLPVNLDTLFTLYDSLTSLPAFTSHLSYIDCGRNQITSLPVLNSSLKTLYCYSNKVTSLPSTLPANLIALDCEDNLITSLPLLGDSLSYLRFGFNQIASIPPLPAHLKTLFCWNCQLTTLPPLPSTLIDLNFNANGITTLAPLPPSLITLDCSNNLLTSLPTLPATLIELDFGDSLLTSLPQLPASLLVLNGYGSKLTSLPTLPDMLDELRCNGASLTSLPPIPPHLRILDCSYNHLTSIPQLPETMEWLVCGYNQLTNITNLPSRLDLIIIWGNPDLDCLPAWKSFYGSDFEVWGTGITCLPNVVQHAGIIHDLDSLPICGLFNPSGCEVAWNIKGQVAKDGDGTCTTTNDGAGVQNVSMKVYDSGNTLLQQVYTNVTGDYSFNTGLGTYNTVVDTTGLPFTVLCPSTDIHTDTLTTLDSLDYNTNFRLYCKPGYDLGVNAICTMYSFFPNRSVAVKMHTGDEASYYGVACNTAGLGGTVTTTINGPVTITQASSNSNAVGTISGSTITWNVTDFSQVDFNNTFSFTLHTNTSAGIGQQVCVSTTIAAAGNDNNAANNSLSQCYPVLNSYDPNEKEVSPAGAIAPGYDGYLTYTIHFQNTGTAPAENIQVIDTISRNLDISTFHLVAFSNQNITQVFAGSRVVKFSFPNINLPDSTANEPASHGYVQYKIKPLSNLSAGDSITNTAYIYFDFNPPIITNTTNNVLDVTGIKNISPPTGFAIYPNPVSEQLTVSSEQLLGSEITITDLLGRTIIMQTIPTQTKHTTIDVSSLTPGVYFITLHSENGNVVRKFVKE